MGLSVYVFRVAWLIKSMNTDILDSISKCGDSRGVPIFKSDPVIPYNLLREDESDRF